MDIFSRIFAWLSDHEAGISAVAAIIVIGGVVLAGLRLLVRRRGEAAQQKASGAAAEPASAAETSPPDLDPLTVPGFEGRPAIAVLPFDNLSGDPEQEYFADGIAEDLITRLSASRWLPVIARNSSFTYKGKAVDVKQVGRELGVRYVVEGSVRKTGSRVRLTAQLIDATTGAHIWAERYDRELQDIFAVQDEITETIVASMSPEVMRSASERASRKPIQNLEAWDWWLRGFWHLNKGTREDNAQARSLFHKVISLAPDLASGFVGVAYTHLADIWYQWAESPTESLAEGAKAAQRAMAIDSEWARSHLAVGAISELTGEADKAMASLRRAIELDPSLAGAHMELGWILAMTGRADEGMVELEKAMRLSPHDPLMWMFLHVVGGAHFAAARYGEAAAWSERSLQVKPDYPFTSCILAASLVYLDRADEARRVCDQLLRLNPGYSLATARLGVSIAEPELLNRLIDALRKAGLPE